MKGKKGMSGREHPRLSSIYLSRFFSLFNARPEASVVYRVLRSAVVHETLCKLTLYCGKNFESQTCDYFGTEGVSFK